MTTSATGEHRQPDIQPLGLGGSVVLFAVPAALMFIGFHLLMPALISSGLAPFYAFAVALGIPLAMMLGASLIAYRKEGNAMTWQALQERFRLHRLSWKMWLLTLGTFVVIIVLYGIAVRLNSKLLLSTGIMPMPESLPAWLDTGSGPPDMAAMSEAFGGLAGNWLALIGYAVFLFINVIGEEFWWRGYILPRQELAFGKWLWVVHGLLWALFHVFKWWDVLALLPLTLILTFLVCRFKNTTIAIVLHFLVNGLGLLPILIGILGPPG